MLLCLLTTLYYYCRFKGYLSMEQGIGLLMYPSWICEAIPGVVCKNYSMQASAPRVFSMYSCFGIATSVFRKVLQVCPVAQVVQSVLGSAYYSLYWCICIWGPVSHQELINHGCKKSPFEGSPVGALKNSSRIGKCRLCVLLFCLSLRDLVFRSQPISPFLSGICVHGVQGQTSKKRFQVGQFE